MFDSNDPLSAQSNRSRLYGNLDVWANGEDLGLVLTLLNKLAANGGQSYVEEETADTIVQRYVAPGMDVRLETPKHPDLGPNAVPPDAFGPK